MGRSANPEQLKAIEHDEGPLLIIAGPGSGKTFTLVERIVHLVQKKSLKPENFFVVTFTEKAARELKTRISNRLLDLGLTFNLNEMYVGTVHSVCLRFLEEYREKTNLGRNYSVLDQFDQQYLIFQHLYEFRAIAGYDNLFKGSLWDQADSLLKWFNKISEEVVPLEQLLSSSEPDIKTLGSLCAQYKKLLQEENALDFSTIQLETLDLLTNHPDVLEEVQSIF